VGGVPRAAGDKGACLLLGFALRVPPSALTCCFAVQSKPLPLDEDLPGMGQFYCDVTGCVLRSEAAARGAPADGFALCCVRRRHFENAAALATHMKCKTYRKLCVAAARSAHAACGVCTDAPPPRRLRALTQQPAPHTQRDAELAVGMAAPDNGPRLRR
jgi:hypothetical protein